MILTTEINSKSCNIFECFVCDIKRTHNTLDISNFYAFHRAIQSSTFQKGSWFVLSQMKIWKDTLFFLNMH